MTIEQLYEIYLRHPSIQTDTRQLQPGRSLLCPQRPQLQRQPIRRKSPRARRRLCHHRRKLSPPTTKKSPTASSSSPTSLPPSRTSPSITADNSTSRSSPSPAATARPPQKNLSTPSCLPHSRPIPQREPQQPYRHSAHHLVRPERRPTRRHRNGRQSPERD